MGAEPTHQIVTTMPLSLRGLKGDWKIRASPKSPAHAGKLMLQQKTMCKRGVGDGGCVPVQVISTCPARSVSVFSRVVKGVKSMLAGNPFFTLNGGCERLC